MIIPKANGGFCNKKNAGLQHKFRINWVIKITIAPNFRSFVFVVSIIIKDAMIKIYKIIQAGAKIHAGGVKAGLIKAEYQVIKIL